MFCRRCGAEAPSGSRFCVHCGDPVLTAQPSSATPTSSVGIFGVNALPTTARVLLGILLVGVIIGIAFISKQKSAAPSSTARVPDLTYHGKHPINPNGPSMGCLHREYLQKLLDYGMQRDDWAFKEAYGSALRTGECVSFRKEEQVYLVDSTWTGVVKVRRERELTEYWTFMETIQ